MPANNTLETPQDLRGATLRNPSRMLLQRSPVGPGNRYPVAADVSTTGRAYLTLTDPDGNPVLIDQHVPKPAK